MGSPRLDRSWLAFLVAVPLAWAVLLVFHPSPAGDDIYGALRDDVDVWLIVHVGTLMFIGLVGAALYLLVRDLPGTAARVSRLAIGPFILFYGAGEAILGIATGVLVQHANDVPPGQRGGAAGAVQALWDDFLTADLLLTLGSVAWAVAAVAAAVAYRHAGASMTVAVLIGLSAIVLLHPPPFGPLGLVFLAAAVIALALGERAPKAAEPGLPPDVEPASHP